MSRSVEIRDQDILEALLTAGRALSAREIAGAMNLRHAGRRILPKILSRLKRRNEIEEVAGGKYRLAAAGKSKPHGVHPSRSASQSSKRDPNTIAGRLVAHRDGYGFVVPDTPVPGMDGDLFIGSANLADAMHGDRVSAHIDRRAMGGRWEGRIVSVTRRAHSSVVGIFHFGSRANTVTPFDSRLQGDIIIPDGEELPRSPKKSGPPPRRSDLDGAVVNVELTRFPKGGTAPAGRVIEILGKPGDFGIDVEVVIRKHHLPHEFPGEVQAAANSVPQAVSEPDLSGRRDFRSLPIVTIDGETAKDFDDAVYVERLANGHWQLQVHIADVAHYVKRGSVLDAEARLRGTSVYFPDRAVPMLPEELSNGICSLRPHEDRLVMSAILELDARGNLLQSEFASGVIHSAERMTYTNVNKVLEGDAEQCTRYAALRERFQQMRELALILNAKRARRGSIDFDLPERVIEFDDRGMMTGIARSERNIAHRLIEEFMLAANEAVAAHLENRAIASLHRVHEKPDAKKVLEFEELAHAFGYTLGIEGLSEKRLPVRHGHVPAPARRQHSAPGQGRQRQMTVSLPGALELRITPHHYQRLVEKLEGKPEERIVSYLMLRSLKQARYAAEALGHFALGADHYTHFTSPIRRYPDLIVHRILKWALENPAPQQLAATNVPKKHAAQKRPASAEFHLGPYALRELEDIATESSESERRADGAERELMDWKTARFMEDHLGEEYEALIISVQKFGFFVELIEIFIEGIVPVTSLETKFGERCMYRERDRAIVVGRGKKVFRLGEKLRVRADRVDPFRHRTEFSVL